MKAVLTGRGTHLPEGVLTNADVAARVDPSRLSDFVATNAWCRARTTDLRADGERTTEAGALARRVFADFVATRVGIRERRVIDRDALLRDEAPSAGLYASDLGVVAAQRALADAEVAAADVDVVVCGTSTPDALCPSTAVRIQRRLGADRGYAFDVMAACTSFAYSITIAGALVDSGAVRRALVVSAEYFSAMADWSDPESAYFAGDGAAAVLLEAPELVSPRRGLDVVDTLCWSRHSESIRTGMGGTRLLVANRARGLAAPVAPGDDAYPYFHQDGPQVYRDVLPGVEHAVTTLLARRGVAPSSVARWWVHQASLPMLDGIFARLLGRRPGPEVAPLALETTGNTSSCGAAYCLATDRGLAPGEHGVLLAFGGGYTVGAALLRGR